MITWTSRQTVAKFVAQNFPVCDVHRAEAMAVYRALQSLCAKKLSDLELTKLVREILPAPARLSSVGFHRHPGMDSLDSAELVMAIEEEQGSMTDAEAEDILGDLSRTKETFETFLGPWRAKVPGIRPLSGLVPSAASSTNGYATGASARVNR